MHVVEQVRSTSDERSVVRNEQMPIPFYDCITAVVARLAMGRIYKSSRVVVEKVGKGVYAWWESAAATAKRQKSQNE